MKNISKILLSFLMVASLSSCSGSSGMTESGQAPTPEPTEEPAELIQIKGIYYGPLSSERAKSSWSSAEGMTDCIVVFDYVNDDENRTMPDTDYANTKAITLNINDKNTYSAFKSEVPFAEVLDRYSEIKQVIGYGNVLGGADPIPMFAIFFINPNDFKSSEEIVMSIDGIEGRCTPDLAKEIKYINTMIDECEGHENEQIEEFLWRCDSSYWNVVKTAKNAAQTPGSDYSLVSDCMKALFSESYGVNLNNSRNWGGNSELRRDSSLVDDLPGFDINVVLEECPDIADDINTLISANEEYANAIISRSTNAKSLAAIVDKLETSYLNIMRYFSMSKTS